MFDVAIVGAGFAGAVLAERFASVGRKVLIIDRRNHVGGNAYDFYDENGILVHKFGPHIFHTNSSFVIEYLSRFTEWRVYQHKVLASVDGQQVPLPINAHTIKLLYGLDLSGEQMEKFLDAQRINIPTPTNAEESVLSRMGPDLYEKFFKNYTLKQWGCHPRELSAAVTARIPIRTNFDSRYFTDKYQMMPLNGYSALFSKMLNHANIHIMLQTEWDTVKDIIPFRHTVYTGPIDEFFNFQFGRLPYRSLEFRFTVHHQEYVQPVATINYPNDFDFTRVTEIKHITGQSHPHTVTIAEYPRDAGDPYYPVPSPSSKELYSRYDAEAKKLKNVVFTGRLGSYQYYNMDQVVASSLHLFDVLLQKQW